MLTVPEISAKILTRLVSIKKKQIHLDINKNKHKKWELLFSKKVIFTIKK